MTLIPEMAVPLETRSAAVIIASLGAPYPKRTVGMVWRKTSALGDQLERIAKYVRAAAAARPAFAERSDA